MAVDPSRLSTSFVMLVALVAARSHAAAVEVNATAVQRFALACASTEFADVVPSFPTARDAYIVRDLAQGPPPPSHALHPWCRLKRLLGRPATPSCTLFDVGKYDEKRRNMYTTAHFENATNAVDGFAGSRDVHIGLDLGAPAGTPVHAPLEGTISGFGYNAPEGDYGHVVVTRHDLDGVPFWILFGHLDAGSVAWKAVGDRVRTGQRLGAIGAPHENGGWPATHLHLQVSLVEPTHPHDMPGTVADADRLRALHTYPDPRLLVGPVY